MLPEEESQIGAEQGFGSDFKGTDLQSENMPLVLSEEQALAKARARPNEALPLHITFSAGDKDNPRNWPKWRKWYITAMASWLNVVTYAYLYPCMLCMLVFSGPNTKSCVGVYARVAFPLGPQAFKRNSECQKRSLRSPCPYTSWAMPLALSCSPLSLNISVVNPYMRSHGSSCSSSSSLSPSHRISEPYSFAGSSQASQAALP